MIVVADASPLIALGQIGRLELLVGIYGQVLIPPAVDREIQGSPDLPSPRPAWLQLQSPTDRERIAELSTLIDVGEAEAVALALELSALLIVDERRGRRVARERGLALIGTAGVLRGAADAGILAFAELPALFDELARVGFWISQQVRDEALRPAEPPSG